MRSFIVIFLTFFLIQACQAPSESAIQANLYVRYERESQLLKAEAFFYKKDDAGQLQAVVFPNGLSFLGGGTATRALPGGMVRYDYQQTGRLPEELTFHWKDGTGEKRSIHLDPVRLDDFEITEQILHLSESTELTFEGEPLAAGEQLILLLTDAAGQPLNLTYNGPSEHSKVIIRPDQVSTLNPGMARLQLVRISKRELSKPFGHFDITQEYYTQPKGIDISD